MGSDLSTVNDRRLGEIAYEIDEQTPRILRRPTSSWPKGADLPVGSVDSYL